MTFLLSSSSYHVPRIYCRYQILGFFFLYIRGTHKEHVATAKFNDSNLCPYVFSLIASQRVSKKDGRQGMSDSFLLVYYILLKYITYFPRIHSPPFSLFTFKVKFHRYAQIYGPCTWIVCTIPFLLTYKGKASKIINVCKDLICSWKQVKMESIPVFQNMYEIIYVPLVLALSAILM